MLVAASACVAGVLLASGCVVFKETSEAYRKARQTAAAQAAVTKEAAAIGQDEKSQRVERQKRDLERQKNEPSCAESAMRAWLRQDD